VVAHAVAAIDLGIEDFGHANLGVDLFTLLLFCFEHPLIALRLLAFA
jgi:hypothetical protein